MPYSPYFDGFGPLDVERGALETVTPPFHRIGCWCATLRRSIFWSKYTDWAMFPHVQYFTSGAPMLQSVGWGGAFSEVTGRTNSRLIFVFVFSKVGAILYVGRFGVPGQHFRNMGSSWGAAWLKLAWPKLVSTRLPERA